MMDDHLGIQQETLEKVHVIRLQGNLDVHNTHKIESQFLAQVSAAEKPLVFDLSGVPFISSAGLRLLVTALKLSQEKNRAVSLCGLQPAVEKVFDIIGMQQLFPIYPDLSSALS